MGPSATSAAAQQETRRGEWDDGGDPLATKEKPPMSASPPRVLIIGAGSRGRTYAETTETASNGIVVGVVEPDTYKRNDLGFRHIWGANGRSEPAEGESFADWQDFVTYEKQRRQRAAAGEANVPEAVDAVFICVQDEMHRAVIEAMVGLGGLHIMCEKPLATSIEDCAAIHRALKANAADGSGNFGSKHVFSIGHVLRYSPHNVLLRKLLLEDRVIGDVLSVVHTEPVGWWHFTHSYVRGNWRREKTSAPSLLTKSCHDIDVLLWLLCSPASYTSGSQVPHLPSTVSSSGSLQLFRKSRKPVAAGSATNCLSCPAEPDCKYSAKRIYVGDQLRGLGAGNKRWPVSIVLPDIEDFASQGGHAAAQEALLKTLSEDYGPETPDSEVAKRNWFGRCVFESDNDVCDDQVVTVTWDEDPLLKDGGSDAAVTSANPVADRLQHRGAKTATFHMVAQTKKLCDRYTNLYGVDGEIYADQETITVEDFKTGLKTVHRPPMESKGHGGGDAGLTRQFILAVDQVKNHGCVPEKAQREIIGCTMEEIIRSHALVFCAEAARNGKTVVDWAPWWEKEVESHLA
ncbi:hypothetical protein SPBR_08342 [Sporothrix brasiliensis 5110]|uniref:Gfo/Idh/MocA-like oxidoreductase N-terminal domain-containing protein n=1 Tax=Sporothrix brasiliensis 5110 TaxID=1398154 RepID=A0A0C2IH07_9PEZI|nr:uncharacterized protein SPBR_08342 [Sporothrix brasiliensis 5110]KIH86295.1 hypothetical protein SPBR_08342 [Sporothrix brasiliensis 5110]